MKTKRYVFGLVLSAWLTASALGCAPDRDTDDYSNDRYAKDLARMEPVIGTYTGELLDSKNRSLGILVVAIDHESLTLPNPQTQKNVRIASLKGVMNLYGSRTGTLQLNNGLFDDKRGEFQASADSDALRAGGVAPMSLHAKLDGDTLTGVLAPSGYSKFPAHFTLRKGALGAESQSQVASDAPNAAWRDETYTHVFEGKGRFREADRKWGKDVPVRIVFTDGVTDTTDLFYTALLQRRTVGIVVQRLDVDVRFSFARATFDVPLGTIVGATPWPSNNIGNLGDPVVGLINCQFLARTELKVSRWGCRLENTAGAKFGELDVSFVE